VELDVPWAEHWVIRDLKVLPNPNNGGVMQVKGFNKVELDNIEALHWSGGQGL
jgi:hypothetical protein